MVRERSSDVSLLDVKPELIIDVALGIHPLPKLAAKYGMTELELMQLHTRDWFNRAVAEKKAELESAGFNFKAKMTLMAEDLLIDAYHAAKLSDAVTPKLDVAKHLAKLAGLEPQPGANLQLGNTGVQVVINFNGGKDARTIDSANITGTGSTGDELWKIDGVDQLPVLPESEQAILGLPVQVREANRDLSAGLDAGPD
jgi:hypothetical protein